MSVQKETAHKGSEEMSDELVGLRGCHLMFLKPVVRPAKGVTQFRGMMLGVLCLCHKPLALLLLTAFI